jgi:uncharacterized membrane protein YcaP (DUF421 family)
VGHDLWVVQVPIVEKVVRTVAVYVLIVVLFRIVGKRGLASLNTFDVVVIFLLSNVVQNAIIGNDTSLLGGIIGAATLIALNTVVNWWLARDTRAERLLEGTATTIIQDGSLDERALRRLSLRRSEIQHAVLLQNGDSISDVARGQLEPDGQLLITLKDTEQGATHGDIQALQARLNTIEQLLRRLTAPPTT